MKRLLTLLFLLVSVLSFSQTLPYSKFLSMTDDELQEQKFKYNKNKNQWILTKTHTLNGIINAFALADGKYADYKPHKDDYMIVIQKGDEGVAYVKVMFYNDNTYHTLYTFAVDHGKDMVESNSGNLTKCQFNYDQYSLVLDMNRVGITSTTTKTNALVKSIDESYNQYSYTIITGIEPKSEYLSKQAEKQEKRDIKGKKKQSVEDMM